MNKSNKLAISLSASNSCSEDVLSLSGKSDKNDLSPDLHPVNIQDNQIIRAIPVTIPQAASPCGHKIKQSGLRPKQVARKLCFIACIQGLAGLQQAYAATYYVSPSGADANSGTTLSTPVRTISRALNSAQSSGDIVYVMTGTYNETVNISQSGITLAAYPNNNPVIDGGTSLPASDWSTLVSVGGNNNTFSGFEVKNSNINGAYIAGNGITVTGHHNKIGKMNVHHVWANGMQISGDYNIVEDSKVWQAAFGNSINPGSSGWGAGLTSNRNSSPEALKPGITSYTTLRRNTVFNNWGEGLSCFEVDHCTLEDNVVYDNWAANLYLSDATNSVVQRNMIYVSTNPAVVSQGRGIMLADEVAGVPRSANNKLINNFIYNTDIGAFSWSYVASGLNNVLIANNTFVDGGLQTGQGGNITNTNSQIRNNIFVGGYSNIPGNSGLTFSNNNWSSTPPAAASSTDIAGDPQLERSGSTGPGALTSAYFKILGSSPVIDAAMPLNNVANDFFQASREAAPDIGGHEFNGSTAKPAADTTAPSAPASLSATAGSSTKVNLTWSASTDNVGVTGYKIYRNGTQLATSVGASFSDAAVAAGTTYSYTVKAYDAAGNLSAASSTATVKTPSATAAVSISSYSAGSITANSAKINWTTNVSSTGVVSYGTSASNLNMKVNADTPATSQSVQISGLTSGTTYYYKITSGTVSVSSSFNTTSAISSSTGTNIAPLAAVTASSQNVYTNQQAIKAVDGVVDGWPADYTREWATVNQGVGAWLELNWNTNRKVNQIVLHDRPNLNDQITGATITFSNGYKVKVGALSNRGGAVTLNFPAQTTNKIRVTVTTVSGSTANVGLAEIKVFGS